jgi:hypothetical protein
MLKALAFVFVVVGLAVATETTRDEFHWETIPVAENSTQCIYRPEVKTLTCRGPTNNLVECPALTEFGSFSFEVLGIRRAPVKSFSTPLETRKYELYPRKLDNQTYLNFIVGEDKTEVYLYFGETSTGTGIRVTDRKCYTRMIEVVFDASKAHHPIKVEGMSDNSIELFGEVLVAEKPSNKRWLGFGWPWFGWGLGMWGWGLGWGLPFWG